MRRSRATIKRPIESIIDDVSGAIDMRQAIKEFLPSHAPRDSLRATIAVTSIMYTLQVRFHVYPRRTRLVRAAREPGGTRRPCVKSIRDCSNER